ncbi:hypothetical protein LY39_03508 [Roseinatronobacter bogoriensis subsp. barguzinensis]|nr:hypothetical protein [Rhodobaca bogoriensis DSM 18756]TDW33884.1 hypothetical protein LY39_03508 [Rhodobaca barguzinensis]TDY66265.1 hypothetical protein EV660_1122 [Rhodobaca bogoriensis DSM 18756]
MAVFAIKKGNSALRFTSPSIAWVRLCSFLTAISAARILAADLEMGREPTRSALHDLGLSSSQFAHRF